MAYIKNNWVDREGTTRYFETVDSDGAKILTPDYTQVTELGTPVNADNMNHIEEGIAAGSFTKFDLNTTYGKNDLVTVIEDGSPVIYKSLVDNNIGNALSSSIAWEKISLGGGGGLEIGDIGIAPLGIDETKGKRRYLNGQLIIQEQYVQFTDKVKSAVALYPSLACTESEWQTTATMTVGGQVGKFVVDDDAGTIRLPKIIMPIQGLTDLSKLAEIVEAGLPNITGKTAINSVTESELSGAFCYSDNKSSLAGTVSSRPTLAFNASLSNPIYGNSNTVQQEQILYPYFIQVATGAETEDNIINEIELNNPFSLLDYKYSEYELNNISWLRSNGQYNSKAIYPAVYDLLLKIYNGTETKAGVSVKLSTETFTDYDFVLNTAEETFRLPIKVKLASGKAVVGNGNAVGMLYSNDGSTVIEGGFRYKYDKDSSGFNIELATIGLPVVTPAGAQYTSETALANTPKNGTAVGITTDPTKSGIETSDSDLYLYFYVGETVQNANLINAGRIEEIKANKTDVDGQIVFLLSRLLEDVSIAAGGSTTIDLSSILPNDGNIYECVFEHQCNTGYNTASFVYRQTDLDTKKIAMFRARSFLTNAANFGGTSFIAYVGNKRSITISSNTTSTGNTTVMLNLISYRKVR